jgi:hypothetical protein
VLLLPELRTAASWLALEYVPFMRLLNSVPGDQVTARRAATWIMGPMRMFRLVRDTRSVGRQARHDRAEGGLEHIAHLLLRQSAGVRGHVAGQVCDPYNAFPPLSLKAGLLSDASDRSL